MHKHDAFISHASEDKDVLVRPLADQLQRYGARIWYDEFELKPGDSLVAKIDRGLADSAHGILIISAAFLSKRWPEYERQGLTAREMTAGEEILVPVWHNVGVADVARFSPTLSQRVALRTRDMSLDELALRLLEVIRPDLAVGPRRKELFDKIIATAEPRLVAIDALQQPEKPIHSSLPADLERRIRLIQGALYEVLPISLDETIENFKRDVHPEREVEHWEAIAGAYLQLVHELSVDSPEARKEIFAFVGGAYSGSDLDRVPMQHVPEAQRDAIRTALQKRDDPHPVILAAAEVPKPAPREDLHASGPRTSQAHDAIVRTLNESYKRMSDIQGLRTGPSELDDARTLVWIGLEKLCDAERDDPGSSYTTIAELSSGARRLLAAQAVVELARLKWGYPRLTCSQCESDAVDQDHDGFVCASCGHAWSDST